MSINLAFVEGTSEKLQRILSSHKIRSTFYTVNLKIDQLQKIKTMSFIKLNVVTVK